MRDSFGWGYSGFAHVFGFIVYGVVALLTVAVTVALIFFFVRFLIYGTKAAQLYIAKNTPAKPAAPVTEPATRGAAEPNPERVPPTTTPTGTSTTTVAAPVEVETPPAATPTKPVVPPTAAAPKAAPKATPPITPPATKKPPVKKNPQPPVA